MVVSDGDSVTVEQAAVSSEVDPSGGSDLPPALAGRPQVSEGLSDRIVVTWGAVDGAETYEVWRALDVGGMDEQFALLGAVAELSYTDMAIDLSTEYTYKIRGLNASGEGSFSREASGWAGTTAPAGEDQSNGGNEFETFGAIEAIDLASLTVNGTVFSINENTTWFDDNNLPADPSAFGVGMTIEVHGATDGNGGWIATRIHMEDVQEGQESETQGTIDSIDVSELVVDGQAYTISESTEWLDNNNNPLTPGDFAAGDMVEVEARLAADGSMAAMKVKQEDAGGNNDEVIDVDGEIEELTASTITVLGTTLSHDGTTEWEDADGNSQTWEDFQVGDIVKVDGADDGNGGWHATRVRLDI